MNPLLMLKTQRVIYLSLLDDGNILEAIKTFEKYQNHLKTYADADKETQNIVLKEINSSRKIFIDKLNNIAKIYLDKEDYNKAAVCLSEVIHYWSKNIYCIINYIICLYNLKQYDIEEEFLEYLKTLINDNADIIILKDLSKLYARIGRIDSAVLYMKEYINSVGENKITYEDYEILGSYYNELYTSNNHNDMQCILDSIDCLLKADELNPTSVSVTRKIAMTASLINNFQLGKLYWDKLFQINPPTQDDLFEYSTFCLKTKDFKGFEKFFDCRFTKETNPLTLLFPKINKPQWKGENISDKTLLILFEQGFGDTFLMYGYTQRLVKIAKKVIFIVQDSIYPLLKDNDLGVEILTYSFADIDNIAFDYYIPSMSLPAALNLDKNNISLGSGYIKADKELTAIFKKKYFNNNKFKIGIAYAGKKNGNKVRNIPIHEFLPLDNLDNIEIYPLMIDTPDDCYEIFKNNNVTILKQDMHSFKETAALIENCDLIISSDNVILNLAGAMGKKTFGIFNWYYEFRWFDLTGEDVVWYKSVKPFVNTSMNDWQSSISRVVNEIKKLQNINP